MCIYHFTIRDSESEYKRILFLYVKFLLRVFHRTRWTIAKSSVTHCIFWDALAFIYDECWCFLDDNVISLVKVKRHVPSIVKRLCGRHKVDSILIKSQILEAWVRGFGTWKCYIISFCDGAIQSRWLFWWFSHESVFWVI